MTNSTAAADSDVPLLSCAVTTLGCRVNQYESERLLRELGDYGIAPHSGTDSPDALVINTCAVTKISDKKSRQLIRKVVRDNPGSLIVVTGCYAELEAESVRSIDGITYVAGNADKVELPRVIAGLLGRGQVDGTAGSRHWQVRVRSMLKVQDGCDAFCTYCAVPYARGELKSRPIAEAVAEAEDLVDAGTRELVLTGIHLGKYGQGSCEQTLGQLVAAILKACPPDRLDRIRLSSLEISEIDPQLETLLIEEERLCKHLHLPLQSGSDSILTAMGRKYSAQEYLEAVGRLSSLIPDLAVTTDVIVGFPAETEEDFARTTRVVQEAGLCWVHAFPFSARDLAPASRFAGQVEADVKERRAAVMGELAKQMRRDFYSKYLGRDLTVLTEKWDAGRQIATGLTGNYLKVTFPSAKDISGQTVKVTPDELSSEGALSASSGYVL